jgi:hypothetical protein
VRADNFPSHLASCLPRRHLLQFTENLLDRTFSPSASCLSPFIHIYRGEQRPINIRGSRPLHVPLNRLNPGNRERRGARQHDNPAAKQIQLSRFADDTKRAVKRVCFHSRRHLNPIQKHIPHRADHCNRGATARGSSSLPRLPALRENGSTSPHFRRVFSSSSIEYASSISSTSVGQDLCCSHFTVSQT